jgi:hypothetical protein
MRIEDGQPEQHPTPLAVDAAHTPALASPTPAFASGNAQGAVRDATAERLSQLSAAEADIGAAQAFGMSADGSRRQHYLATMAPLGASAGDVLPVDSPPLDPGAAPGEAEPTGAYYDPPRGY